MERRLEERVAVITGGGKGIGAGISKALATEGAKVIFNYNSNPDMARNTATEIQRAGGKAFTFYTNVTNRYQVDAMMAKVAELYGGIDILVNNAAWQPNMSINDYTEEAYDGVMNINLAGYFRCMQAALPYLKKSKYPRIVNISSVHAVRPGGFDICYSMTKGGIKMLTREAAIEFAKYGITVNDILPGSIEIEFKSDYTRPFTDNQIDRPHKYGVRDSVLDSYTTTFTVKQIDRSRKYELSFNKAGVPEDVANAVIFLALEQSHHISGTSIIIDGGAILL